MREIVHHKIKGRSRFYKHVDVEEVEGGKWRVTLDKRPLRTPARQEMHLPNKALALAVATEWDAQISSQGIQPSSMPMMTLVATAIDQIRPEPQVTIDNIMRYLHTDTACYFASPDDRKLLQQQKVHFSRLHEWIEKEFGLQVATTDGMQRLSHPPGTEERVLEMLRQLNEFELAALQCATMECKSIVMGLAVLHGKMSVEDACTASRLEEEANVENWGLVEGGHDIDRANNKVMLSSASFLARTVRL